MKLRKRNAFTLIELIATLVIMAIIALIVTPLVMTIIKKARISADKRSVDAYGRSIELAIAGYLMDTGSFPTSIDQLTIEYSGDEVVCSTTQLNSDSSVYLAGCTVGGRSVEGYTYGSDKSPSFQAYSVGNEVTYNNVDYYVIKDSSASDSTVTLLKAEPLTVAEVNQYGGVGTANNHVNMYATYDANSDYYQKGRDVNGYGGLAYYSSESCGNIGFDSNTGVISDYSGCKNDYASSEIKYVVDAWKASEAPAATEARLITKDEIENNFNFEEYDFKPCPPCESYKKQRIAEEWMGVNTYWFTMSQYDEDKSKIYAIDTNRGIMLDFVTNYTAVVRPVITLSKTNISS